MKRHGTTFLAITVLFLLAATNVIACGEDDGYGYGEIKINLKEGGKNPGDDISAINSNSRYNHNIGQGELSAEAYVYLGGVTEEVKENGDVVNASWGNNNIHVSLSLTKGGSGEISYSTELINSAQISGSTIQGNGITNSGDANAHDEVKVNLTLPVNSCGPANISTGAESNGVAVVWKSADGRRYGAEVESEANTYGDNGAAEAKNNGQVSARSSASNNKKDCLDASGVAGYNLPSNRHGKARVETSSYMNQGEGWKYVTGSVKTSTKNSATK